MKDGSIYTSAGVTASLARQFKRETGMTPGDYVEAVRVDAARRILEESDTPLKKVAGMCGFADQSGLRRAFVRRINVTPVEYRQRFAAIPWLRFPLRLSGVVPLMERCSDLGNLISGRLVGGFDRRLGPAARRTSLLRKSAIRQVSGNRRSGATR